MFKCKNCNKEFDKIIYIDGKRKDLKCRKYCLDCCPFGDFSASQNCVACCKDCNFMKRAMSYTEFLDKIIKIYKNFNRT